ncbi:MAG: hypothetical protein LUC17_04070, partial [Oscillospiraceae bacterium]|nr:hypothetical protein [Oscillospiraceae bacterium]
MFTNSLFLDYLLSIGLEVWHEESTRDIICLEFNYGTRSYRKDLDHLYKVAKNTHNENRKARIKGDIHLIEQTTEKRKRVNNILYTTHQNRKKYQPMSKEELRTKLYNEGISVSYPSFNRDGTVRKVDTIHYRMLYRSTGKAKKGSCMFICDRLYEKAHDFLYMGITLPQDNAMIVEASAYAPLISSGIVGKIQIDPKNILILEDVERYFTTNIISIETDEDRHCYATPLKDYRLKNTLFDGQALIDHSLFTPWANGYVLLREHFCKMAAFDTYLKDFFMDYFGAENYYTATVKDMFGIEHKVSDIQVVTTDNAMKWIKFGVSYEELCARVAANDCAFGIVKTEHESKFGELQRMSYQMVNSLSEDSMQEVAQKSIDDIARLKTDDEYFLEYLEKTSNFSNDHEVLVALCRQNPDFIYSSYFRSRKNKIIEGYTLQVKSGKLMNNADNLTIIGSPYAMLLYAATGYTASVDEDDPIYQEAGT